MTCETCEPWAATSAVQLRNRKRNILEFEEATPFVCPRCNRVDWATTDQHVLEPDRPRWTLTRIMIAVILFWTLVVLVAVW